MMNDWSTKVKITNGIGNLDYQHFVSEDLIVAKISAHAVYSSTAYEMPLFLVTNGSLINVAKSQHNVLAMINFSQPHQIRYLCDGLQVPLTITPLKLQFRMVDQDNNLVKSFNGYVLIELSVNYQKNSYI